MIDEKVLKILLINGANGARRKEIIENITMSNKTYVWGMSFLLQRKLIYCSDKQWYVVEKLY